MIFFIRYTKNLGSTAIYTRLRNDSGQYWDFSYLVWVNDDLTVRTRVYLTETQDADAVEALYSAEVSIPSGTRWVEETVLASTSRVIGYNYVVAPAETIALTLKQLLYAYVGSADNVFSKISGSFVGQIDFYVATYAAFSGSGADPGGTQVCTLASTGVMSNTTDIATDGNILYFKLSETPTAFEALSSVVVNIYNDSNKGNIRIYVPNDTALVSADYVYYPTANGGLMVYENGNLIPFAETAYGQAIGLIPSINWDRISQPVVLTTTSVLD